MFLPFTSRVPNDPGLFIIPDLDEAAAGFAVHRPRIEAPIGVQLHPSVFAAGIQLNGQHVQSYADPIEERFNPESVRVEGDAVVRRTGAIFRAPPDCYLK